MRKGICLIFVSQLIMLLFTMNTTSPVFAASERAAIARINQTNAAPVLFKRYRPWRRRHFGMQENNQYFRGTVNNTNNKMYRGHDQGNSGNHGHNRGYNEDNSSNAGNQIINRRYLRGYQRNNQHHRLISNNSGNLHYFGYEQGNSGNSGGNSGFNRDDSSNLGNQIIN